MIPTASVNGSNLDTLFVSLSILGILLLVGTILRLYVPFFKKYYFPASLIAGFIGLLLGPNILNVIPQNIVSCWSSLSGKLIVLVFAPTMGASTLLFVGIVASVGGALFMYKKGMLDRVK